MALCRPRSRGTARCRRCCLFCVAGRQGCFLHRQGLTGGGQRCQVRLALVLRFTGLFPGKCQGQAQVHGLGLSQGQAQGGEGALIPAPVRLHRPHTRLPRHTMSGLHGSLPLLHGLQRAPQLPCSGGLLQRHLLRRIQRLKHLPHEGGLRVHSIAMHEVLCQALSQLTQKGQGSFSGVGHGAC